MKVWRNHDYTVLKVSAYFLNYIIQENVRLFLTRSVRKHCKQKDNSNKKCNLIEGDIVLFWGCSLVIAHEDPLGIPGIRDRQVEVGAHVLHARATLSRKIDYKEYRRTCHVRLGTM